MLPALEADGAEVDGIIGRAPAQAKLHPHRTPFQNFDCAREDHQLVAVDERGERAREAEGQVGSAAQRRDLRKNITAYVLDLVVQRAPSNTIFLDVVVGLASRNDFLDS